MVETSVSSLHFGGNISNNIDICLHRTLSEGGGSKLVFEDKNPEVDLRLDLSSSAHVRRFHFGSFAYKLCMFLFVYVFNHSVGCTFLEVLSRGMTSWFCFPFIFVNFAKKKLYIFLMQKRSCFPFRENKKVRLERGDRKVSQPDSKS